MKKITIFILVSVFILLFSNIGMMVRADEITEFYTYTEWETRVINDREYIETSVHGYRNFPKEPVEPFYYTLPGNEYSGIESAKILGIWVNEERLDSKYYFSTFENKTFTVEFDTKDKKKGKELGDKFATLGNFEIIISVYIKSKQEFYKKEGKYIFLGRHFLTYGDNDIYLKYTLILPYPSEHSLKTTATMKMKRKEEGISQPPLDIEIKNGDLILSWYITFPDKHDQFEKITGKETYLIYVIHEEEGKEQKTLNFDIRAEYSYETLPLLQLLYALIISFPIGFAVQFFRDVQKGEYDKIEKLKTRKWRIIRKIEFFGIKNLRMKLKYTIFSFIVLGAAILILFAPDIFNTEAIRIFHVKLSSMRLFSIEVAKFIQGFLVWILTIFLFPGFVLVMDFEKRKKHIREINSVYRIFVGIFELKIYGVIVIIILALFALVNGLYQPKFFINFFYLETGFGIFIFLAFVAYLKLYWAGIR